MKKLLASVLLVVALYGLLALSACQTVESTIRKLPPFEFESWAHADRYGVFTDTVTLSGAKWVLNEDGSATLTINQYDGSAAWAGTVGPHDVVSKLSVTFPPASAQAVTLAHLSRVLAPRSP